MVLLCDWSGAWTPSHAAFYEVSARGRHCVAVCSVCTHVVCRHTFSRIHALSYSLTHSPTILVNTSLSYATSLPPSLSPPLFPTLFSRRKLLSARFPSNLLSFRHPSQRPSIHARTQPLYSLLIIKTYAGTAPLKTMLTRFI